MTKEFHTEQSDDGHWEVRDRAGVWVADFATQREAQAFARAENAKAGF